MHLSLFHDLAGRCARDNGLSDVPHPSDLRFGLREIPLHQWETKGWQPHGSSFSVTATAKRWRRLLTAQRVLGSHYVLKRERVTYPPFPASHYGRSSLASPYWSYVLGYFY